MDNSKVKNKVTDMNVAGLEARINVLERHECESLPMNRKPSNVMKTKTQKFLELIAKMETEMSILNNMMDKLYEENIMLSDKFKQGTCTSFELNNHIMVLKQKIHKLKTDKANVDMCLGSIKKERQELMEKLEQNVRRRSIQESELESEIRKLKTKIYEFEDLNKKQKTIIDTLEAQMKYNNDEKMKEWNNQILRYEENKSHLEYRIARMIREQDSLTEELDRKIRGNSLQECKLENEVTKLKAKVDQLEITNKDLKDQISHEKNRFADFFNTTKQKYADLKKDLADMQAQRIVLIKNEDSLIFKNTKLKNEIDELRENLKRNECEKNDLKSSLRDFNLKKEEIKSLKAELEQMKTETKLNLSQIDKFKIENDKLKDAMKELMDKLQFASENDSNSKEGVRKLNALIQAIEHHIKKCEVSVNAKYLKNCNE